VVINRSDPQDSRSHGRWIADTKSPAEFQSWNPVQTAVILLRTVCYTSIMKIPRTIPEFRRWLRAEIATLGRWDDEPEVQENLFSDAASMIRNARRLAIALEQPAVAAICEKIKTPALALPKAQRILTECLNALQNDSLTVAEAARHLGVSVRTVYDLVRSGRLRASRIGNGRGAIRIAPADLDNIGPTRRLRHL
jgi:excisionase family DNA binding protein